MLESDSKRRLRVGLFTASLVALFATGILLLGKKQGMFERHERYHAQFEHVGGLVPGAAVWMDGVVVGSVEEVELSSDPAARKISVRFRIAERLVNRVRADSRVRIRTLGLLGDRYLELSSGDPGQSPLEPGSSVVSVEPTDVAAVLSKGGDAVTNLLAITTSLRQVFDRNERGEGIIGQMTVDPESGKKAVTMLTSVLEQSDGLLHDLRAGKGALGRLIADPKLADTLIDDLAGFAAAGREITQALSRDLRRDDSVVAALLRDPEGRARVGRTIDAVATAAAAVGAVSSELMQGKGALPRLINDKEYAKVLLDDLSSLTYSLRSVADKLDRGQGSAARLVNDPTLVRDMENVIRGVDESKMVRWLVRNRRQAGERNAPTPTPTPVTEK
jgi:phospholipid/cholesterol/gamma-HCH transport system substrate-binding protein